MTDATDRLLDELGLGHVDVSTPGPEHVLPSPFRVTDVATASIAGATAAIADLGARRTGSSAPSVEVDRRHAAIAFRSERHVRVDGEAPTLWDPIAGHYPTAGGRWVQLHTNFPHHLHGVLGYLGVEADRAAVAEAIARHDAFELEAELTERGMICAAMRSLDEWAAHPHAAVTAGLPLVEIERIDGAHAAPPGEHDRPTGGLRVLDLTRIVAGPVATRTLAAHGADVLRVASPGRPTVAALLPDTTAGKRAAHVDLDGPGGRGVLERLVAGADVIVQSYRPGSLDRRGFGPAECARLRPGIVHVSVSAYGDEGPWGGRRGFDSICQTATGLAHEGGRAAGLAGPRPLPCQALDHATGFLAAAGAAIALRRRLDEGGSWAVRVALIRTRNWLVGLGLDGTLEPPEPDQTAIGDLLEEVDSAFGSLTRVRPPGTIGGRAPSWTLPPTPDGAHPPRW
ncbi:MAG: CoA transferase [Actinomycetota bacterium]